MDVRCERCSTLYDFDEARVPLEGLAVKCSSCGYVFRVYRAAMPAAGDEWMLRQPNGNLIRFKEMTTLQRWVVERRVSRDDEISRTGKSWQRLGEVAELTPFFQAIEATAPLTLGSPVAVAAAGHATSPGGFGTGAASAAGTGATATSYATGAPAPAAGARWEGTAQQLPQPPPSAWQIGTPPQGYGAPAPYGHAPRGPAAPDDDDFQPRSSKGKWIALALVVLVAGSVGATWALAPDLVARLLPARVNQLALEQVNAAYAELEKDSYGAIEGARGMFEKAVALDPKFAAARAGLAQAELARAEYVAEETAALSARLVSAAPGGDATLQADIDGRKKDFQARADRAFTRAKEALELEPDGAAGLRAMADYYRVMNAPESMKPLLERARQRAPTDPWVAYVTGASAARDPALAERAIRYFDEALEAAPGMNRARYKLARVFQDQGNKPKALLHTETILKAVPDHERARALMDELNPPPPAAAAVEAPKEKEPTYEQLFARAERLREGDRPDKALELYERAVEMQPADPDGYTGMGWCYYDMERYDAAVQSFGHALELAPRFSDAHFGIAEAYQQKGMKRDAVKHYRAYLDLAPDGEDAELAKRMLSEMQQ